jgi:acetylornithine deacetylase/succinyl-diaminopimelate desuccinylase-like protein
VESMKEVIIIRSLFLSPALINLSGRQDMSENVVVASPAVAEKGSFNLRMEVSTPGGHSSVPPEHTVRSTPFPISLD